MEFILDKFSIGFYPDPALKAEMEISEYLEIKHVSSVESEI